MTTESVPTGQQSERSQVIESERGIMLALLVMVVLGVAAIFAVSGG